MGVFRGLKWFQLGLGLILCCVFATEGFAEEEDYLAEEEQVQTFSDSQPPPPPVEEGGSSYQRTQQYQKTWRKSRTEQTQGTRRSQGGRKYLNDDSPRVDSGVFHVGFAVGGNFYTEPEINATTKAPTGNTFKDFGFQAGVYFDWDYSELPENIPLGLRGMIGYKYILSSVHVFTFDGVVRHMWRFSEDASFGLGMGGSAAVWFRSLTTTSPEEEIIFLPSFIITAGFDFPPFLTNFNFLINRFGEDSNIYGLELYFGFRL